jgi:hypothetical protein
MGKKWFEDCFKVLFQHFFGNLKKHVRIANPSAKI